MSKSVMSMFLMAALSLCTVAQAQSPAPKSAGVVDGEIIPEQEVESAARKALENLELRRAQFETEFQRDRESALDRALESVFRSRVLSAEAAKRGLSVDELLAAEVDAHTPLPDDDAVARFFDANQSQLKGGLVENAAAIREYLRSEDKKEVYEGFVARLKKDYGATSYREPYRFTIDTAGHPSKGPADAAVVLVEFSDFECPFCGALFPTLRRIEEDFKNTLRIVYFQFPLADIHSGALKAAEASLCAFDQNRFWEMHDLIFARQTHLGVADLKERAAALGLDVPAFADCLDSGRHNLDVQRDVSLGLVAGVSGTPALFINGRLLIGSKPYEEIREIIEDELARNSQRQ